MDFTGIDSLITRLEKKKSLRPGSPPVVVNGHLGVWRTIRHHRMFLELTDRGKNLGRVLIGPPSFVGNDLDNIPSSTWAKLTPKATLKEFRNVDVADGGIQTLKDAIRNAIGDDDTRRKALEDLNTATQLVPIARSAGFTDDEIKQALAGTSPNKPLPPKDGEVEEAKAPAVDEKKPKERRNITDTAVPKKPTEPTPRNTDVSAIEGALARLAEPGTVTGDREKFTGEFLVKLAEKSIDDEILKAQVKKMGYGLQAGDYKLSDVKERLREVARNREAAKRNRPSQDQLNALEDRSEIKETIDNFDQKLEEKVKEEIKRAGQQFQIDNVSQLQEYMSQAQAERIKVDALTSLLEELAGAVKSPRAKTEIKKVVESLESGSFNRKSVLLRLYQILQILLLLVPGL